MKWINVNKSNKGNAFELWFNDNKLMSLSFNTLTKIARLESASDKRLFFVEKKSFSKNKTVIKNEYGIKLGELNNSTADEGVIEMDGKKYGYSINNSDNAAVILYDQTTAEHKPFLNCNLSGVIDGAASLVKRSIATDSKLPFLLMALCWYLVKPSGSEILPQ